MSSPTDKNRTGEIRKAYTFAKQIGFVEKLRSSKVASIAQPKKEKDLDFKASEAQSAAPRRSGEEPKAGDISQKS